MGASLFSFFPGPTRDLFLTGPMSLLNIERSASLAAHTWFGYLRCKKCHKQGHRPQTIALDPLLFDRMISDGGVNFNKKQRKSMSSRF